MSEFDENQLDKQYGCDPWDEEHFGYHLASRQGLAKDGGLARARKPGESITDYLDDVCPEEDES